MKKTCLLLYLFTFCFIAIFSSGCGTTAKFVYPSKADNLKKLSEQPKYDLTVAVIPFEENRNDKNDFGGFFLYMIPLVPYGTITYERPDAAELFNTISKYDFNASEDFAKAAVTSLKKSNLFKDVYFTYGGEKANADLILSGSVLRTLWEGKTYSYCLSFAGPILWFLGLPAGSSHVVLELKMSLNNVNSNTALWDYGFQKDETSVQGLYYGWGYDCKSFTTLMENGMNEAVESLDKKLSTIPVDQLKKNNVRNLK